MNRPRLTLIVIVAAVIAAVYLLDVSLERVETAELHNEAQGLYIRGENFLSAGNPKEAIEPLQRAYALERTNRQYQLAYAEALLGADRQQDAASLLNEIIRQAPNDAKANLLLARLARAQGDFANESAYYHRAIYGVWGRDSTAQSNQTRLEWVRELIARDDRKLLLGELLQLEAESQDLNVLAEVAHDLLLAGAPGRAVDLYRSLITAHPDNAGFEEGLGQAEAASGEYAAAQRAYERALRIDPDNASIRNDMQLTTALSAMDPTPRRLPSAEKYRRSLYILRLVHDTLAGCGADASTLAEADQTLQSKHPDTSNEAAEQVLQLAETLWRARPTVCPAPEVLPVMMQKLAQ